MVELPPHALAKTGDMMNLLLADVRSDTKTRLSYTTESRTKACNGVPDASRLHKLATRLLRTPQSSASGTPYIVTDDGFGYNVRRRRRPSAEASAANDEWDEPSVDEFLEHTAYEADEGKGR